MFCKNCGKEIDDNAVVCIHCGVAVGNGVQEKPKKVNGFGIVGFILSLLSLWMGMFFYCAVPILSVIFSIVGLALSKKRRVNGLAIAGLVIGIICLLIWGGLVWLPAILD